MLGFFRRRRIGGGPVVRNLNVRYVVGRTFDLLGIEIPDTAHIPPPAEPTVAPCVMPATMPPSELTVINVTAESVRAERVARRRYGPVRRRSYAPVWRRPYGLVWRQSCALRTRLRCAKADNGGATSIDASATTMIG